MATITGVKSLIRLFEHFFKWIVGLVTESEESIEFVPSPILQFADFIVEYPVVFIFVVAVPLMGLGIGLLRRMLNA